MKEKKDILSQEDVKLMVDSFYQKVGNDHLLGPIFNDVARIDWEDHLPKMYEFWESIILGTTEYRGRPFPPHALLPIHQGHFQQWLNLFKGNIDDHFEGKNAELAKFRAESIAQIFQSKLGLI